MTPPDPADPYQAAVSQIRLRAEDALGAARTAHSGSSHHDETGTAAQLHLVMRALEQIAELADVDPYLLTLHSAVLSPAARGEPSACDDRPRPRGIMDSIIVLVDYCTPAGRDLSAVEGRRVVSDLVTELGNDMGDLGWADCIDLGSPRGATVHLVGPDRHRLWDAVESALNGWPLRAITALLRSAERGEPDTFHQIGFEPEVDRDLPEKLVLEVLASMSRAMWEVPTPPLRAVALDITRSGVRGRFLYAEPPTEDEIELVSLCETYFIADFPLQFGVAFDVVFLPIHQQRTLRRGERWIYLRREPDDG